MISEKYWSMSSTKVLRLRKSIDYAVAQKQHQQELRAYLESKAGTLHKAIMILGIDRCETLCAFVIDYITHVPDMIESLTDADADNSTTMLSVSFYLLIIDELFIKAENQRADIVTYLRHAYFAHRFFEEYFDRVQICGTRNRRGENMMIANIIVHALLGETTANHIDLAVVRGIDKQSFEKQSSPNDESTQADVGQNYQKAERSCFAGAAKMYLDLSKNQTQGYLH